MMFKTARLLAIITVTLTLVFTITVKASGEEKQNTSGTSKGNYYFPMIVIH